MADALATVQPQTKPMAPQGSPANPIQPTMPTADDYTLDPVAAAQRQMEYNYNQRMAPVFQTIQQQLAGTARGLAAQSHAQDFQKWGPEIDGLVATVPQEQRTTQLYEQAVKIVRANHIEDIVAERTQARMAEMGIERTSAGGNAVAPVGVGTVSLDKLDPAYKAAMDRVGIGQNELNEFLAKTHQSVEQFVDSVNRKQVITDVSFDQHGRSKSEVGDLNALYGKSLGTDGKPVVLKEW